LTNNPARHDGVYGRAGSVTVTNTIMALNKNGISRKNAPVTGDYNLLWQNTKNDYLDVSPGPNDVVADPLFRDLAANNYHLTGLSPARDAGTTTGAPTTDYEGQKRKVGDGSVDIGADETGRVIRVLSWRELTR